MGSPSQFFFIADSDRSRHGRKIDTNFFPERCFLPHDFLARRKMADKKNPECNPPHLADAADLPDANLDYY